MSKLEGKTAVITGGTRGIGRAVARRFAEEDAKLAICSRRADELDETQAELEDEYDAEVVAMRTDVRDEFDVELFVERASNLAGSDGIDVVIANAAVYHGSPGETPLRDEAYSTFDDVIRTNVRGVFSTVKEALPHMPEDGRVVVPSGNVARDAIEGYGSYAVSKAGAEAVMRQFSVESDQAVGCLDPGAVATNITEGRGKDPEDVADMYLWAAVDADYDELNGEVVDRQRWREAEN